MPPGVYERKPYMKQPRRIRMEIKAAILRAVQIGLPHEQIEKVFGVSASTVQKVKREQPK